jgi:zinc protease
VIHALEARHAPVVSLWVWYHVGGRNEVPGTTGMSHFLEHMLFKGTPAHPKGDLDRLLARYGAQWNAFTNEDVTCYFETVPRDRYEVALELEADRMRNALISTAEVDAERTVIVSEREGYENDPSFLLGESLQAVAFDRHPYGQGVIGSKFEIQHMTRDGLYAHYRTHYAPNNAYVVVVGDDRAEALVEKAAAAFGPLRAEGVLEPPFAPEPPQMGEKRLVVHRAGGALPIVQLGFHAAPASDPRAAALQALGVALAGGGGGDSASGRSSRLYRALVEKELATEIDASVGLTKDPFLFTIEATVRPGVTHRAVEDALLVELQRLGGEPIDETEFARVRRGLLASIAFPSDTITWRAFRLGSLLSSGAAPSIGAWYEALANVTPAEVQRAARETFIERSRTVGHFIPEAG